MVERRKAGLLAARKVADALARITDKTEYIYVHHICAERGINPPTT